ncbi:UNVERIFIED_CONTAM: Methylcrotonoyl-CoA carboxylase subunit alpha, mitochondrial [Sesamum radiatum]|uniref:Methylcrotonoyl-CoA carboxylase subunit alpha, mitochondrial n=1 Tax=Sesamum radiatum TaxID=300843 RepID=A0AAW2UTL7_SESRA
MLSPLMRPFGLDPPARLSYLSASTIIEAASRTGAQAIHPGYGFLSESSEFAQLCEDEGFIFIGPPASAIRDMGDKSASKRIMGAAGVPLVPGYHGDEQDIDLMKLEADRIGYPVLIKPTHGGGGKGMRIVQSPNDFADAFVGAQREAAASFGINTILLEKYITKPRHIEVQPNISNDFRSHLGKAAVSAAKAVGYHNAGTVEFIVDTLTGEFYFMEMNTRLQVEHPVTEMIVGQDLVEWQIRVANGEPLPVSQSDVPLSGHAFEARIYAENVPKGFLPATGILHHYRPVQVSSEVRVETGVEQGDTVSMHYDPMIAKLVVWGEDRTGALIKMKDCLSKFQVAGLPTNIDFLLKLSNHGAFENGEVETHFIDLHKDDLFIDPNDQLSKQQVYNAAIHGAAIAAACVCEKEHAITKEGTPGKLSLWYANPPFRVNYSAKRTMELEWEDESSKGSSKFVPVHITCLAKGKYLIEVGGSSFPDLKLNVVHLRDHDFRVEHGGVSMTVSIAVYQKDQMEHIHIWHGSSHHHFKQRKGLDLADIDESYQKPAPEASSHPPGTVVAPMAGLVVKVLVQDGAKVVEGQPILVLEAMKMEHVVKAPSAGCISGLRVSAGQQVSDGTVLFAVKLIESFYQHRHFLLHYDTSYITLEQDE